MLGAGVCGMRSDSRCRCVWEIEVAVDVGVNGK